MLHPDDADSQQQQQQQHQPVNRTANQSSVRAQQRSHDEAIDDLDAASSAIPPGARSPHPYRRLSLDIPDRIFLTNLAARERQQPFDRRSGAAGLQQRNPSFTSGTSLESTARRRRPSRRSSELSEHSSGHLDAPGETRRSLTTSPSDSGTEADDERAITYLRGLPSAAGKTRKGLKDESGATTPSDFDGVKQKLLLDDNQDYFGKRRRRAEQGKDVLKEQAIEARSARYGWKWRGELLRRVLEHVFLCALTHCCLEDKTERLLRWPHTYDWVKAQHEPIEKAKWLVAGTLLLYLARAFILWTQYLRARWRLGSITLNQVPSPFDPGTTLYPLLLPLAVAAAGIMTSSKPAILLLNLVLGLCTYPVSTKSPAAANLHWALILFVVLPHGIRYTSRMPFYEDLTFLLPLHASLVATIQHFTSTSLLTAESQLLSVGLINLLFFAQSPQSLILFTLLWFGGVVMLLGCRHVMKWSTILARIPGWRFRSPRHAKARVNAANQPPRTAIGTLLRTSNFFASAPSHDSSDDKEWVKVDTAPSRSDNTSGDKQLSAGTSSKGQTTAVKDAATSRRDSQGRRHTLPTITRTDTEGSSVAIAATKPAVVEQPPAITVTNEKSARRQRRKTKSKPFLWLTRTQAGVVKWLLALYSYVFALTAILLPIRWYIQDRALHRHEPVGWALSYLFGDISAFRLWVIMADLDTWIPLPPRVSPPTPFASLSSLTSLPSLAVLRLTHLGAATTRLAIVVWCLSLLALGLLIVFHLRAVVEVDTRRKVFHGMMVAMFLPTIPLDPCFIALALTLMLAIFLLLDLFRAAQLPPISRPLTNFLAPYVDGRDHKGPVVISPIFLLIGCAIPLWLSLAGRRRAAPTENGVGIGEEEWSNHPWKGWEVQGRDMGMMAGVICVGMGDAAASLIGRRYGRRRWVWSGGKSLEGSAAFVVAVSIGLLVGKAWMYVGGWQGGHGNGGEKDAPTIDDMGRGLGVLVGKTLLAGMGASFTEAVLTAGNDNVIVPVVLWLLVRCLGI